MHLKDKITSHEQLLTVTAPVNTAHNNWDSYTGRWVINTQAFPAVRDDRRAQNHVSEYVPKEQWWLVREWLRSEHKVYPEPSEVLKLLRLNPLLSQYVPHVSTDDPLMIAFTASVADGQADKQTRTTLGKFLRKYAFMLTDAYIQQLDAEHRADMLAEIELLPPSQFQWAYMNGPTSCMSHKPDYWHMPDHVHPLDAYDAPGFHLAIIRKSKAEEGISARCVVWINPDNPEDKRAIRVYGDAALKRRLLKNGYKFIPFTGAKIRTVPVKKGSKPDAAGTIACAVPYLDGVDGTGTDGYQLIRRADGYLHIISNVDAGMLTALAGGHVLSGRVQGKIDMSLYPEDKLAYRCGMTGEIRDSLQDEPAKFYTPDPGVMQVSSAWLHTQDQEAITNIKVFEGGSFQSCWVFSSVTPMFKDHGVWFLDRTEERRQRNFYRLDAALYPDRQDEWLALIDVVLGSKIDEAGEVTSYHDVVLHRADMLRVATRERGVITIHKDTLPKSAVRVADIDGDKCYAAPGASYVVTDSGRKVLPGLHEVVRLHNGVWTYKRNALSYNLGNLGTTWVLKKDFVDGVQPIVPEWITEQLAKIDGVVGQRVWAFLRHAHALVIDSAGTSVRILGSTPSVDRWSGIVEYVRRVLSFAGKTVEQIQAEYPGTAAVSAQAVRALAANAMTVFAADQAALAAATASGAPTHFFRHYWVEVGEDVYNDEGDLIEPDVCMVLREARSHSFYHQDSETYTEDLALRLYDRHFNVQHVRASEVTAPVITLADAPTTAAAAVQEPEPIAA